MDSFSMHRINCKFSQGLILDVETSSSGPCGNIRLKDSDFHTARYCSSNFNNLVSSFVVLFELMVVNQWHVVAEGHVLVTGTEWTKGPSIYQVRSEGGIK